jgi:LuxR family maltose regulon positive regulatory protein
LLERNEIEEAERALTKGIDLLQWIGEYEALAMGHIALVRLRLIRGDEAGAQRAIERLAQTWPACGPVTETLRIQFQLSRFAETHLPQNPDALAVALRWAEAHQPVLDGEASIPGINPWGETHHVQHLTRIQVQLAHARSQSAASEKPDLQPVLTYLERRLDVAQGRGLVFRVIELSVMQALALDVQGDTDRAVESLRQALLLAEPEGYGRVFIDQGEPMQRLLQQAATRGIAVDYVAKLLAAFHGGEQGGRGAGEDSDTFVAPSALSSPAMLEPLSERELEVLRLLTTELSGPEIARELMISLNTVRTHTKNIYSKLNVNSRRAAVHNAEERNLL